MKNCWSWNIIVERVIIDTLRSDSIFISRNKEKEDYKLLHNKKILIIIEN